MKEPQCQMPRGLASTVTIVVMEADLRTMAAAMSYLAASSKEEGVEMAVDGEDVAVVGEGGRRDGYMQILAINTAAIYSNRRRATGTLSTCSYRGLSSRLVVILLFGVNTLVMI